MRLHGSEQQTLFSHGIALPDGLVYRPYFLTLEEESELLGYFQDLPFEHPLTEEYAAKRRIINFGWGFDFKKQELVIGPPLPPFLQPLQRKVAKWLDIPVGRIVEALVTEYSPGSAIGWHRDNETFDTIIGISLGSPARMRLRPLQSRRRTIKEITSLTLESRSAYCMQGESRWNFQHSIPCVESLRYSITFRTLPAHYTTPPRTFRPRLRG